MNSRSPVKDRGEMDKTTVCSGFLPENLILKDMQTAFLHEEKTETPQRPPQGARRLGTAAAAAKDTKIVS